jgi:hypothetical protein
MKQKFRDSNLGSKRLEVLSTIQGVIESYQAQGYTLTLRQLYYQLVSRDLIANSLQSYKRIGYILTEARYAGLVDWGAIEDRLRRPKIPYYVTGIPDALSDTFSQYRLDRMKGQETYVEVWVEKDALSSVLSRVTNRFHIRLMVNRGYSSASAMYDAYNRFSSALDDHERAVILYLGDHDPSGLDMVRDIEDRTKEMLAVDGLEDFIEVKPIALTMEQIRKFNPPPNPAKITDSRAAEYIARHGRTSWELDALPPEVLNKLLTDSIEELIDLEEFEKMVDLEKKEKATIGKLIDQYRKDNE